MEARTVRVFPFHPMRVGRTGILASLFAIGLIHLGNARTAAGQSRPSGGAAPHADDGSSETQGPGRQSASGTRPLRAGSSQSEASHGGPASGNESHRAMPLKPEWADLPPAHEQYLNDILKYWEHSSSKIERYQCTFTRWVYDLPTDAAGRPASDRGGREAARQISQGLIKYMAPDKAMYQARKVWNFDATKKDYVDVPVERHGDHWICDGEWIYEFDYPQSTLRKIQLPPDARGEAISKGPLPFLFRAKGDEIRARFWMRVDTPPDVKGEYHLEAAPRTQEDAAMFRVARIVIAETDYLPKAIVLVPRTNDGRSSQREVFVFENREINWTFKDLLNGLNLWQRDFYEPSVPKGWKLIEQPYRGGHEVGAPGVTAERPAPGASRR
ncbi:MAG: hypothetical protein FJ297_16040 [Planctomycetes bacterium]|nr:hypothetical protein [Planctomycetota bacterium]